MRETFRRFTKSTMYDSAFDKVMVFMVFKRCMSKKSRRLFSEIRDVQAFLLLHFKDWIILITIYLYMIISSVHCIN